MSHEETFGSTPLNRRSLIGAAALAAGVAVLFPGESARAQSDDAEGSRFSGDRVSASIRQNVVETDSGKVSGFNSGGIVSFRGIPYGASTGGANRFMAAQMPAPWTGVRSALHWGWVSPQLPTSTAGGRRAGWAHDDEAFMFQWSDGEPNEDMLRINIWTPATDGKKRPVMFWIHGGGFTTGHANEMAAYDGENLARRGDVVVCSINHRLGPLGFMNLTEFGDEYAHSANNGMLDIVAALGWVKTNIANFGGDPGMVTVFGQSGGGGKVATLMGMPAAKGLFHRAIVQSSGTFLHQLSKDTSAKTTAAMMKQLGITKTNLSKLQQVPDEAILQAALVLTRQNPETLTLVPGFGAWSPVVDGHDIPRDIWDPTAPEFSRDVPLMIGTVLNEMGNSIQMGDAAFEDMDETEVRKRLQRQFPGRADKVFTAVSAAHTIRKPFDVLAIAGGLPRRVDAVKAASLKAAQGAAPVYMYKFVWQTPILDGRPRSFHCSELPFVFFNSQRCSSMTGGTAEAFALSEKMSDAWLSFARSGNPSHAALPKWAQFSAASPATMVLDVPCVLKNGYDAAEIAAATAAA